VRNLLSPEQFLASAITAITAATIVHPTEVEFPRLTKGKNGEPIGASRRMIVTKASQNKKHKHLLTVWEMGASFPRTISPAQVREYKRDGEWVTRPA
jgi:hypothetical protein